MTPHKGHRRKHGAQACWVLRRKVGSQAKRATAHRHSVYGRAAARANARSSRRDRRGRAASERCCPTCGSAPRLAPFAGVSAAQQPGPGSATARSRRCRRARSAGRARSCCTQPLARRDGGSSPWDVRRSPQPLRWRIHWWSAPRARTSIAVYLRAAVSRARGRAADDPTARRGNRRENVTHTHTRTSRSVQRGAANRVGRGAAARGRRSTEALPSWTLVD